MGNEEYIKKTYKVTDAEAWARAHVEELNKAAENNLLETTITFNSSKDIFLQNNAILMVDIFFFRQFIMILDWIKFANLLKADILLNTT